MAFKYAAGCPAPCATAGNVTAAALAEVVAAAKASEYTVAVLGHTTFFENESRDRVDAEYQLPPPQLQMLKAIAAGAPQTKLILVLVNGMAIGVPWAKANVPAIIEGLRGACFSLLCFRRLSCPDHPRRISICSSVTLGLDSGLTRSGCVSRWRGGGHRAG